MQNVFLVVLFKLLFNAYCFRAQTPYNPETSPTQLIYPLKIETRQYNLILPCNSWGKVGQFFDSFADAFALPSNVLKHDVREKCAQVRSDNEVLISVSTNVGSHKQYLSSTSMDFQAEIQRITYLIEIDSTRELKRYNSKKNIPLQFELVYLSGGPTKFQRDWIYLILNNSAQDTVQFNFTVKELNMEGNMRKQFQYTPANRNDRNLTLVIVYDASQCESGNVDLLKYFSLLDRNFIRYGIILINDKRNQGCRVHFPHSQFVLKNVGSYKFKHRTDNNHVLEFPIGYQHSNELYSKTIMVTPINRKYLWSFAGDITKFLRSAMLTNMMKQLPWATFNSVKHLMNKTYFTHLIYKWNDENSLSREKYIEMLKESIFCPCPATIQSFAHSFRFYEALEHGCIPIVQDFSSMFPNVYTDYIKSGLGRYSTGYNDPTTFPVPMVAPDFSNVLQILKPYLKNYANLAKLQQAVIKWWENEKRVTRRSVRSHITKYLWRPSLVRSGEGSFKCTPVDHFLPYVCTIYDVDNTSMALKNIKPKSTSRMIPVVRTNDDVSVLTAQKAGAELNTVAILIDDKDTFDEDDTIVTVNMKRSSRSQMHFQFEMPLKSKKIDKINVLVVPIYVKHEDKYISFQKIVEKMNFTGLVFKIQLESGPQEKMIEKVGGNNNYEIVRNWMYNRGYRKFRNLIFPLKGYPHDQQWTKAHDTGFVCVRRRKISHMCEAFERAHKNTRKTEDSKIDWKSHWNPATANNPKKFRETFDTCVVLGSSPLPKYYNYTKDFLETDVVFAVNGLRPWCNVPNSTRIISTYDFDHFSEEGQRPNGVTLAVINTKDAVITSPKNLDKWAGRHRVALPSTRALNTQTAKLLGLDDPRYTSGNFVVTWAKTICKEVSVIGFYGLSNYEFGSLPYSLDGDYNAKEKLGQFMGLFMLLRLDELKQIKYIL
jgi:hypothetical protein